MPLSSALGGLAARGALWSAALIISRQLVNVLATVILSRLLWPKDYGIFAMPAAFTGFLAVFSELGLSGATIQRRDLTQRQLSNLFWINTALGCILFTLCLVAAPLVAGFYGRSELKLITATLGIGFLAGGVGVQPSALLIRQMKVGRLFAAEGVSQVLGALAAIVGAFLGWGYWALVLRAVLAPIFLTGILFTVSGFRPGWPRAGQGTVALLKFGGYLAGFGAINYFARNLDNVLIGKVWGAEPLGYYTRAYFLMMLPVYLINGSLSRVILPALSVVQKDKERFGRIYRNSIQLVAIASFPLTLGMAVVAKELVQLFYGPHWATVAPILVCLSLSAMVEPICGTIPWLYISVGDTRRYFFWGLIATPLTCVSFVAGLPWGPIGVAAAYAAVSVVVLLVPGLWLAHRAAQLPLRPTLLGMMRPLLYALIMAIAAWSTRWMLMTAGVPWWMVLIGAVVVGAGVYSVLLLILQRDILAQAVTTIRQPAPEAGN